MNRPHLEPTASRWGFRILVIVSALGGLAGASNLVGPLVLTESVSEPLSWGLGLAGGLLLYLGGRVRSPSLEDPWITQVRACLSAGKSVDGSSGVAARPFEFDLSGQEHPSHPQKGGLPW